MNKIETYSSKAIDSILKEIDPKLEKQVEFRMKLAAKIDNARKKLGWNKKQLAEKLSKRPSEISKWLSGTHNFTSDTLFDIQVLMGIELINLNEKPKEQVLRFSFEVSQTESGKTYNYGYSKPINYQRLYSKSANISNLIPGLENFKTVAKA
jgi:transcriptional regulator with XRE-family HTH domain